MFCREPEKAQLTMFYGGKVVVFDNFPAEKAKELMQIASKGQNFTSGTATAVYPSVPVADVQNFSAPAIPPVKFAAGAQPNFSGEPLDSCISSWHLFMKKFSLAAEFLIFFWYSFVGKQISLLRGRYHSTVSCRRERIGSELLTFCSFVPRNELLLLFF